MKFLPRQRWPEVTIPAAWKSSAAHFGRPSAVSLIYGVIKARVVLKLQPETRREQVTTQLFADDHPIKTQHKSMKRNLTLIRVLRFCKNSVRPLCWICNELNFRSLRNLLTFCQSATPASSRTTTAITATGSCRKSTDSTRPIKSAASISRPSSLISTRTLRLRASSTFWKQVLLLETLESWYGGY